MKIPGINELRTIAMLQTNAPKILYGSGVVGAGRKDVYQDFKQLRGKFTQKNANRDLGNGNVLQVETWEYIVRFENAVLAVLGLQCRFIIEGKTYTLKNWNVEETDYARWFIFTLEQFGR